MEEINNPKEKEPTKGNFDALDESKLINDVNYIIDLMKKEGKFDYERQKDFDPYAFLDDEIVLTIRDLMNFMDNKKEPPQKKLKVNSDITFKKSFYVGYLMKFFDRSEYRKLIDIVEFLANSRFLKICFETNLKSEVSSND